MRTRWTVTAVVALVFGALGGALFSPQPAGAVSKEIVELQQQMSQLLQGQQDLRSAIDTNSATLKTLVQQSLDGVITLERRAGRRAKIVSGGAGQFRRPHRNPESADAGTLRQFAGRAGARRQAVAADDRHAESSAKY